MYACLYEIPLVRRLAFGNKARALYPGRSCAYCPTTWRRARARGTAPQKRSLGVVYSACASLLSSQSNTGRKEGMRRGEGRESKGHDWYVNADAWQDAHTALLGHFLRGPITLPIHDRDRYRASGSGSASPICTARVGTKLVHWDLHVDDPCSPSPRSESRD